MLANIFDFVGLLPEVYSHLTVPHELICEVSSRQLKGEELLELSSKCYSRCLKLNHKDEFVWFELTSNYYQRAFKFAKDEARANLMKLALSSGKHLVRNSPKRWQNWNLLGIICATREINDPALTQHCFIKAINLDKKTFTSWSNLGVFYLIHGNIKLANKAFGRAQQSDTTFERCWIGQVISFFF